MFSLRAVAPKNIFRFGEQLDFVHPVEHGLVRRFVVTDSRRRRNSGRDVFHALSILIRAKDKFLPVRAVLQGFFLRKEGRLREEIGGCLLEACSESLPPMIIGRYL